MKSKTVIFRAFIATICFLSFIGLDRLFCEEQDLDRNNDESTRMAHEQALKNYDTHKQKEQEELITRLSFYLSQAIESWINAAKRDKLDKLDTRLEQQWEKLSISYPVSPTHYEYYLRGYKYYVVKSDINKTDSLTSPYKGVVIIKEDLYVEKNHPPNISNANPYFYTVSTNFVLNLEYKNEKFILVNSNSETVSIENDCPNEIKKLRL